MSDEITDRDIIQAMIELGGSFVSHLGDAARYADATNLAILKVAYAGYWSHYRELAILKRQRAAEEKPL